MLCPYISCRAFSCFIQICLAGAGQRRKNVKQIFTSSMTLGSRSTKTALGTCLPAPVSEKKVLKLSSATPNEVSEGIRPSGWMPCSRQYSSLQHSPVSLGMAENIKRFLNFELNWICSRIYHLYFVYVLGSFLLNVIETSLNHFIWSKIWHLL